MLPAAKKQHCSTSSRRAHRISGSRPLTACRQLQLQYRVPRTHCCAAAGNKELSPKVLARGFCFAHSTKLLQQTSCWRSEPHIARLLLQEQQLLQRILNYQYTVSVCGHKFALEAAILLCLDRCGATPLQMSPSSQQHALDAGHGSGGERRITHVGAVHR